MPKLVAFTDGGCRGNPGPAAWAFVVIKEDGVKIEQSGFINHGTNFDAEYTAVMRLLDFCHIFSDPVDLTVYSDCKVMVEQLNGNWKIKDEKLHRYYDHCIQSCDGMNVTFEHVRREFNKEADALVNTVLDQKLGRKPHDDKTLT